MTDRETIESTLRRVQSGDLSPDAATELLLAGELSAPSNRDDQYESLASLIHRLGIPPEEIVETWCSQMRGIAQRHEQQTSEPLPVIDLDQWSIMPSGQLAWQQQTDQGGEATPLPSAESLEHIDQFRNSLIADQPREPESALAATTVVAAEPQSITQRPPESPSKRQGSRGPAALPTVLVVGLLVVASAIGWAIRQAAQAGPESAANIDTPDTGSIGGEPAIDSASVQVADEMTAPLETLESLTESQPPPLDSPSLESPTLDWQLSVPLDRLMSAPTAAAGEPTAASDGELPASEAKSKSDAVMEVLSGDDDQQAPAESPQPTRTAAISAVSLGSVDETTEVTPLPINQLTGWKLEFPFDLPLSLTGVDSNWIIHDSRSDLPIASIVAAADQPAFRWTDSAKDSPAAPSLIHGRITNQNGETVFLRPVIEADPWPFHLDQPDVMPMWKLGYPIPPRAARISLDFDLPEAIEEAWIEPIEPESLRRSRGVAVLTPKDGETVSLGIRFDIRCGRKLTCRMRYAGRLDPSLPWQLVSVSLLEQFANQLADQAASVSTELSRLERVSQMAGTSGRRILRIKQDRAETVAEMISATSQRVGQLQKLMAGLEAEGSVKLRVWVEWPAAQQDLFTMEKKMGNGE